MRCGARACIHLLCRRKAKEDEARLQKAENLLQADQDRVKQLTDQVAKAPESKKDALQADLIQAQADVELAQDEVDDAREDLIRAGGDIIDRIQALKKQHEETAHGTPNAIPTGPEPVDHPGVVYRIAQWRQLHQKQLQLWSAKTDTDTAIATLTAKHNALDAEVDAEKAAAPELAHHSKGSENRQHRVRTYPRLTRARTIQPIAEENAAASAESENSFGVRHAHRDEETTFRRLRPMD